jgi:protein-disulfide isomerase
VPDDWADEVETGIRVGPRDASLTVVEFMDFECPFCARWAARLDSLMAEYGDAVQVTVHHFPLPRHPHALPAALAAECAHEQGRFPDMKSALFANQAEFGTVPWDEIADQAGLPDLEGFGECMSRSPESFERIAYGIELGRTVGVRGTPTVWIDGVSGQPSLLELRRLVREAISSDR